MGDDAFDSCMHLTNNMARPKTSFVKNTEEINELHHLRSEKKLSS